MATKAKTYQQLAEELAEIIAWFEGGDVDLDQALAKYQKAVKLIAEMEDYLKTAQNQLKKIKLPQ